MVYTWYIHGILHVYAVLIDMSGIYLVKNSWVCSILFFIMIYRGYTMNILNTMYIPLIYLPGSNIPVIFNVYSMYILYILYLVNTMYIPCIYHVYTLHIQRILLVYTKYIHGICSEYTSYIYSILCAYSTPGGWC